MSRTQLTDFTEAGPAFLTESKLEAINEWYKISQGDMDKADEWSNHDYYEGNVNALKNVLWVLHNQEDFGSSNNVWVDKKAYIYLGVFMAAAAVTAIVIEHTVLRIFRKRGK